MKADFNARIENLEESNRSLSEIIDEKDKEISDLQAKVAVNNAVQSQQEAIQKVVENHQTFLEKTDSFRGESNIVVFGLEESPEVQDKTLLEEILQYIECPGVVAEKCIRLGKAVEPQINADKNVQHPPRSRPRPLLVVLKSREEKAVKSTTS